MLNNTKTLIKIKNNLKAGDTLIALVGEIGKVEILEVNSESFTFVDKEGFEDSVNFLELQEGWVLTTKTIERLGEDKISIERY